MRAMASNSQCDVSFSWETNKPVSCVTSFSFVDVPSEVDTSLEINDGFQIRPEACLQLSSKRSEGAECESKSCILQLTCPHPEKSRISGFSVTSESRILEISTVFDGYLQTVKGKKVYEDSNNGNKVTWYTCKCYFEESYPDAYVKFLSIGRSTFSLHSLVINITQDVHSNSSPVKGTFDLNKLKKDVDQMGNTVSNQAKDFLLTLEQFEQNKLKSFQGMVGETRQRDLMAMMMSNYASPVISGSSAAASGLSGILGTSPQSSENASNILKSLPSNQTFSTFMSMLRNNSESEHSDVKDKNGSSEMSNPMYKILQAVCGRVTDMRATEATEKQKMDISDPEAVDGSIEDIGDQRLQSDVTRQFTNTELIKDVEALIDTAKKEIHEDILQIKSDVMSEIHATRCELESRLDKIIDLLSKSHSSDAEVS